MNRRYIIMIGLLSAMIIYQYYLLHKDRILTAAGKIENKVKETADVLPLTEKLKSKFRKDIDSSGKLFDEFFNDEFFKNNDDPFKEMEKQRKNIFKHLGQYNWNILDNSWNAWYDNKFGNEDMQITTQEKEDKVVMEIKIQGLNSKTLNINIDDNRIAIECDKKETTEKKNKKGVTYYNSSSYRHISKILPIPQNTDAKNANIETKENKVIIIFPKRNKVK